MFSPSPFMAGALNTTVSAPLVQPQPPMPASPFVMPQSPFTMPVSTPAPATAPPVGTAEHEDNLGIESISEPNHGPTMVQMPQAFTMAGPSTIALLYPANLPPRDDVDLNLHLDDVIITDEPLGRGAWGEVCRGLYQGRDVAVKFIRWNGEVTELRSLQHELTILARLQHPHILEVYGGSVRPDPEIFLVQELLAGSVSDVMYGKRGQPGRRLSLVEALRIGRDILRGLCYLHSLVVLHRDIKPDNTLLTHDGQVAKIGDFGLARFKLNTVLQTRTLEMGTAAYMAPEIFDSDLGNVTVAVDIYSFGVTLWEMIAGEQPYKEFERDQAIMWQVLRERRPRFDVQGVSFPPEVEDFINRCWAQTPTLRPTAQAALDEIEELLAKLSTCNGISETLSSEGPGGLVHAARRGAPALSRVAEDGLEGVEAPSSSDYSNHNNGPALVSQEL